jgi:prepilin-type N-terminal cleavage/methylation domain-containing protein
MMRTNRCHQFVRCAGFTFIEISMVLAVIALLFVFGSQAFSSSLEAQERREAIEQARTVQAGIRAYALRNGRLPCPATDRSGYENRVGQQCSTTTKQGYVPYVALGLPLPSEKFVARYAVYRSSNATLSLDSDLTEAKERTGDSPSDTGYMNTHDLLAGLMRIDTSAVSTDQPYVTGDEGSAGAIDCATNKVSSVAYWLMLPLTDMNNDGQRLDASNTDTNLCVTYPLASRRAVFDDIVIAETPLQLAGWLKLWMQP